MSSLYQDILLDHYRNPRNNGVLLSPTHHGEAENLSCGDALKMDIEVRDDKIKKIQFTGSGCAVSQASASLLTEKVSGMHSDEARSLSPEAVLELLQVPLSPTRIKCALLSLETLKKTLVQSVRTK
jgi:nitrogen fixation protein NifU and related proteins